MKISCSFFFLILRMTDGYSGSDLTALAKDAALGPIRGRNTKAWNIYNCLLDHFRSLRSPYWEVFFISKKAVKLYQWKTWLKLDTKFLDLGSTNVSENSFRLMGHICSVASASSHSSSDSSSSSCSSSSFFFFFFQQQQKAVKPFLAHRQYKDSPWMSGPWALFWTAGFASW